MNFYSIINIIIIIFVSVFVGIIIFYTSTSKSHNSCDPCNSMEEGCTHYDTHHYDRKIKPAKTLVPSKWKTFTPSERQTLISNFYKEITDVPAKNMIKTIVRDIDTPANYDPINDNYADEIFANILYLINTSPSEKNSQIPDTINNLIVEQLNDMYTGACPQGRSTRLFQIYNLIV